MEMNNFKLVFLYIFIGLILLSSCDDGWFMRKRWEGRRASISIEESKTRKVFIKKLKFKMNNSKLENRIDFFLEKGYKWGYLSSKNTRTNEIKDNDSCQVVGIYKSKFKSKGAFGDTLLISNDYYTINKNIPVDCNQMNDTLKFYLVVNRSMYKIDTISKISVWNSKIN